MLEIRIKRGFADTPKSQIHYAEAGIGKPVLLLHQTPRSWDEYRDGAHDGPNAGEFCNRRYLIFRPNLKSGVFCRSI